MAETEWIEIGQVVGDTGPKGDTGDTGIGTTIKGKYNTYEDLVNAHPRSTGEDAYIIDGEIYYWNSDDELWESGGSIKGETGDTGAKGDTGDSGEKGDTGDTGVKGDTGDAFTYDDFTPEQLAGLKGDTGDTGVKGDTGDTGATGAGVTIKGSYNSYEELVNDHPTGSDGDSYLVNGSLYVWNGTAWENVGNIKGDKGDTGEQGVKGDTGDTGFSPIVNVDHVTGQIVITTEDSSSTISFEELKGNTGDTGASGFSPIVNVDHESGEIVITTADGDVTISFDELKGDTGDTGAKGDTGDAFTYDDFTEEQLASLKGATGDTGSKGDTGDTGATGDTGVKGDTGDAFTYDDFTEEQLASLKGEKGDTGATGDTGAKGDTGEGSDEEAGWKLPVDEILTTTTLPTGVSTGYRVAIVTSSVMAIKEYNGSSWDTETLDAYSVIPLKHSGSIQMYLAKSTGPVYMGVEYGVFGKFKFMTQSAYDALSSYDSDTIYFVRSS